MYYAHNVTYALERLISIISAYHTSFSGHKTKNRDNKTNQTNLRLDEDVNWYIPQVVRIVSIKNLYENTR